MRKILILASLMVAVSAQAQEQVGHGGDPIGAEVGAIIADILEQSSLHPEFSDRLRNHTLLEFKNETSSIPIQPVKKVKLNGRIIAMKNFSHPPRIEVGRKAWKRIPSYREKKTMVLHEILGSLEEEPSETYAVTYKMLPYVSCGVTINNSALNHQALEQMKNLLLLKNYAPTSIDSDYQLVIQGNLIWLKDADGKTIWSGDYFEKVDVTKTFPSAEYIPKCGER